MDIDKLVKEILDMANILTYEGYIVYLDNEVFQTRLRALLERHTKEEEYNLAVEASLKEGTDGDSKPRS